MQPGKWYKVRVAINENNTVSVYIDGDKVFEQIAAAPSGQYTVAGYDENTGETIIKVVNSTAEPYTPVININASSVDPVGKSITLSAKEKTDENTMAEPTKIVPVETVEKNFGKQFSYTFKPYSFTILKVKSTK